jgi:hypothetical protein
MTLPPSLLPEDLDPLSPAELRDGAVATARLIDRSRYDLGRALNHIRDHGAAPFGYSSALEFARAELGLSRRDAYHLMRLERVTRNLPAIRAAYARAEVTYSNARAVVQVATPEDEDHWLEVARTRTYREVVKLVWDTAHARAEAGEAPWPETGLYGEMGRPDPKRACVRPYTEGLLAAEAATWELHNRFVGADTSWTEFFEAALASYRQELELHHGLLRIEGTASEGFRFARRPDVFAAWEYWPDLEPVALTPWERTWEADDRDDLPPGPAPASRPYREPPVQWWSTREAPPGGERAGTGRGCERADTGSGRRGWLPIRPWRPARPMPAVAVGPG